VSMPVVMVAGQAGSRVCDDTDPVPDVRPPGRVDGAAGTVGGVEGRRDAGAAPGDRGPAAPASSAEAGLGRPGGTRRPDAAAATAATDRHQRWHPRRQGTDIAASPFTARSSQATLGRQRHRIMAGYPVHRRANSSTAILMARKVHTPTRSPARSRCRQRRFHEYVAISTSERQPLARRLAATESERPLGATTGHSAHIAYSVATGGPVKRLDAAHRTSSSGRCVNVG
jgi:hypothetical protein